MTSLKEQIDAARLAASDKEYDNQREFADTDRIEDLSAATKCLADRISDTERVLNYHGASNAELDAAIDTLTEALTTLDQHLDNLAARIIRDEELIGIDDESDATEYWSAPNSVVNAIDALESDMEENVDTLDERLDSVAKEFDRKIDKISGQIATLFECIRSHQDQLNKDPER